MATPTPLDHPQAASDPSEHGWVTLTEEQASQGFKTGHMRWVLAVGVALAGVTLGLAAVLN